MEEIAPFSVELVAGEGAAPSWLVLDGGQSRTLVYIIRNVAMHPDDKTGFLPSATHALPGRFVSGGNSFQFIDFLFVLDGRPFLVAFYRDTPISIRGGKKTKYNWDEFPVPQDGLDAVVQDFLASTEWKVLPAAYIFSHASYKDRVVYLDNYIPPIQDLSGFTAFCTMPPFFCHSLFLVTPVFFSASSASLLSTSTERFNFRPIRLFDATSRAIRDLPFSSYKDKVNELQQNILASYPFYANSRDANVRGNAIRQGASTINVGAYNVSVGMLYEEKEKLDKLLLEVKAAGVVSDEACGKQILELQASLDLQKDGAKGVFDDLQEQLKKTEVLNNVKDEEIKALKVAAEQLAAEAQAKASDRDSPENLREEVDRLGTELSLSVLKVQRFKEKNQALSQTVTKLNETIASLAEEKESAVDEAKVYKDKCADLKKKS